MRKSFLTLAAMAFLAASAATPAAALENNLLQRISAPAVPQNATPVPRAGNTKTAQCIIGWVCRWGMYYCGMSQPGCVGNPCFCPGQGNGVVSTY
ncbi:MAG TPA: hypothetical protein VHP58_05200 [Alphaproteobacteria bacterium]|nr:hypothetical protein [Alphaproteobacteria bacterium]